MARSTVLLVIPFVLVGCGSSVSPGSAALTLTLPNGPVTVDGALAGRGVASDNGKESNAVFVYLMRGGAQCDPPELGKATLLDLVLTAPAHAPSVASGTFPTGQPAGGPANGAMIRLYGAEGRMLAANGTVTVTASSATHIAGTFTAVVPLPQSDGRTIDTPLSGSFDAPMCAGN